MVRITICIEGGGDIPDRGGLDGNVDTYDIWSRFRYNFSSLFEQLLSPTKFDLLIEPIGSIHNAPLRHKKIVSENLPEILLIDLDGPKSEKPQRLSEHYSASISIVFFMIQEMEAWIISQKEKIEVYGKDQNFGFNQKKDSIQIYKQIASIHPEDIEAPKEKLRTIFNQLFRKKNKNDRKPSYRETKDGPKLIGLLDLVSLKDTFEDVKNLIEYIESRSKV